MSTRTIAGRLAGGGGIQIATGTYIGDGNATQAIVGIGFKPTYLIVYIHRNIDNNFPQYQDVAMKTDQDGLNAFCFLANWSENYMTDDIISLDADGFTVGDGSTFRNCFNNLAWVYTYVAFG